MQFVHLHNHSYYSILDGLNSPEEIVKRAVAIKQPAIALTDHGNMLGAFKFYEVTFDKPQYNKERQQLIKPIIGCELYICHQSRLEKPKKKDYYHLVVLAENNYGYQNLLHLVTESNLSGYHKKPRIDFELLRQYSQGLIALSACIGGSIPQAFIQNKPNEAVRLAKTYLEIFGKDNFFIELQKHDDIPQQLTVNHQLIRLARELNIGLVATNDSHYTKKENGIFRDELSLIAKNSKFKMNNGDYSILSTDEMIKNFKDLPEAIENTVKIANRCNVTIEKSDLVPKFTTPNNTSEADYLQQLCEQGLYRRYRLSFVEEKWVTDKILPKPPINIITRYEYELKTINSMGFSGYFLIVQDYIAWSKKQGIYVGPAKGSAAGSLVSYLLGITEIDPLPYDLLFERFLNPNRNEMPDIDVDFQDDRRIEVIDYVRQKYGTEKVSLVGTITTLATKNAIRTAARVQAISLKAIQPLLDAISNRESIKMLSRDENQKINIPFLLKIPTVAEMYLNNKSIKKVLDTAIELEGVARSIGTHACAVIISNQPIKSFTPLQRQSAKSETIITQYEARDLASLGCLKMDFLGIKTLTTVANTLKDIEKNTGNSIDLNSIPLDIKEVYSYLANFNGVGVYQFESEGMQQYLHELKPDCIQHLIAMNAMYRPGPIEYIPSFIKRKNEQEQVCFDHPVMKNILKETYGITAYQEQVMLLSVELAGFSQSQADDLRKAISKKKEKELNKLKPLFYQGCKDQNNINEMIIDKIWGDWLKFASYAFNKSHATAYAIVAYQTAYLKFFYPVEYMKNLLNSYYDDSKMLLKYIAEAKRMGIAIKSPDINLSSRKFTIANKSIIFGMDAIKNVRSSDITAILNERDKSNFTSLGNLYSRVSPLTKATIKNLSLCGALESLCPNRKGIIDTFSTLYTICKKDPGIELDLYRPLNDVSDYDDLSKAFYEKQLLGFYATINPFTKYKSELNKNSIIKPVARSLLNNGKNYYITAVVDEITLKGKSSKKPTSILTVSTVYNQSETMIIPKGSSYLQKRNIQKNVIYNFKVTAKIDSKSLAFIISNFKKISLA